MNQLILVPPLLAGDFSGNVILTAFLPEREASGASGIDTFPDVREACTSWGRLSHQNSLSENKIPTTIKPIAILPLGLIIIAMI